MTDKLNNLVKLLHLYKYNSKLMTKITGEVKVGIILVNYIINLGLKMGRDIKRARWASGRYQSLNVGSIFNYQILSLNHYVFQSISGRIDLTFITLVSLL
ncbi:hypothetical protein [Candidatus Nitrosocosmicus sp. SS]|uniref:hypothetical protein n=1 Tax=Candidatus Nitrosocosmicus agrestis TaxID=2563600 RepID=UPI00122E8103|nr:hypothetical protein [Candidatus Nitrosocosmicus sp. SS]KAA2283117.1 hypothetical protein F1Z66_03295 [Candidatus Nitrosocosmicus sp. SS]KAF0868573.1 hypothetical protein E5N71_09325 [Candidatus Nitrosocosmicus sp. SS]